MNIVLMQTGNELSEIKLQALLFIIFTAERRTGQGLQGCVDAGTRLSLAAQIRGQNITFCICLWRRAAAEAEAATASRGKIVLTSAQTNKQTERERNKQKVKSEAGERQMRKRSKPKRTLWQGALWHCEGVQRGAMLGQVSALRPRTQLQANLCALLNSKNRQKKIKIC